LLPGAWGAKQTLVEMKRLIIEAIHSQSPRALALNLLGFGRIRNPENFVDTLKRWFLNYVTIVDEFEELLESPLLMIEQISQTGQTFGDCDDVAMLAASILSSIGAKTRLQARFQQTDGSFSHVFCQYQFPDETEWSDFDPTIGYVATVYDGETMIEDIIS
jgi:transglutaminase-like putative cysteine protease